MRLEDILLTILPMVLLIGAWFFLMARMRAPGGYQNQCLELMRRQADALERLAAAAERRAP